MYWETPGNRTDENDYVLLAREESDTMIDKIATSAPVAAISDFNKAFLDLLISSIGFVAALSWNDYIKSLFQKGGVFYERVGSGGLLYVAMFITVLAYVATGRSRQKQTRSKHQSTRPIRQNNDTKWLNTRQTLRRSR
jgi:hypothetical protein